MATAPGFPAEIRHDQLRIFIDTPANVPARDAGELLRSFDRAFARYAYGLTGRRGFHLDIIDTGTGSWWALLQAAYGIIEVNKEYPDLIPIFMNNLSETVRLLMENDPKDAPKYLRELARSIGKTGIRARATAIEIVNIARVSIDPVGFEMLARPEPRTQRESAEDDEEERLLASLQTRMLEAGSAAKTTGLRGTLHKVGPRWYADAEGFHDVLLPLKLTDSANLSPVNGGQFVIYGSVARTQEGHPVAIVVRRLRPTGDHPRLLT